jgi:valyl-tRNA synthetase
MEKQYNHTQVEASCKERWEKNRTYGHENNSGPLYAIDTPPPTVSGSLHIGHIFSYTQTDIVARYKRMSGFSVYYPFGFDDNGLPTERYVEKKRKIRPGDVGRSAFIELCLQETRDVEHEFKELWQHIGLSVDWDASYSTISAPVRRLSQASFIELYKKGYAYRKNEPALYCPVCRTSVAQAELDDEDKPSFFNSIIFKGPQGEDLVIGTTRPELLPSCVALMYHPEDSRYQHLKGSYAISPLFNEQVPVIEDDTVTRDKGTGLVMVCTFGDKADIEWYKKHNFPYKQSIDRNGKMLAHCGSMAGLKVAEARKVIIEELKTKNLLTEQKPITHGVHTHERCKNEIEFLNLPQWFIELIPHKEKFLAQADNIAWYPSFMKARYVDWVKNLNWDWCISRQRFFGIPFPAWHCTDCGHVIVADTAQLPIDPQETPHIGSCPQCNSKNIVADTDVMDTWNTSSITPYICAELFNGVQQEPFAPDAPKNFLPMSMRPQAHDIIRTWAFYTIVKAWMHHGILPWKEIIISGHVLSDKNEKLSKSRECGPLSPQNLLSCFPADAVRYWTASASLGQDVAFSENQLKIGRRLVTKLWNAFLFVHEHIAVSEISKQSQNPNITDQAAQLVTQPQKLGVINEWLIDRLHTTTQLYHQYLDKNEFGLALTPLETFFWTDFCDNYLEVVKHQLFNPGEYTEEEVAATRWTLTTVGLRILQLYAPYLPYVTEAIYQELYRERVGTESIHQTRFSAFVFERAYTESRQHGERLMYVVSTVRKLKSENKVSLKTPLLTLTIFVQDAATRASFESVILSLKGVTQTQEISFIEHEQPSTPVESTLVERDGAWHAVVAPLAEKSAHDHVA